MAEVVRIELISTCGWNPDTNEMTAYEAAEIWLADPLTGKLKRTRKPAATLVDDSRPGVLRQLAEWIEAKDDPELKDLAAAVGQVRNG